MRKYVESWLEKTSFDATRDSRLKPGAVVGGWRVVAYLGCGLSAEVYRVEDCRYGNEGALKLLIDDSRGLKARFLAEAEAIRFLTLKALPRFMGAGDWQGAPYYVMEYLRPLPDPMPRRQVAAFMNKVAKAVQTLHDAGFVHRDLKPGNILVRGKGEPVLIDLGLIKRRGTRVSDPIVRHTEGLSIIDGKPVGVGTLDYAAPEQLLKGEFSVQSDIFSLGKVMRVLYRHHPPTSVKPILRRATREQPSDRYASANDFAAAIRHRFWPLISFVLVSAACALGAVGLWRAARGETAKLNSLLQRPQEADTAYVARIKSAAEAGNPLAQLGLAEAYFNGKGVATNREEGVKWYRLSAAQGESEAQASLGLCLFRGWGCEKNQEEAIRWYRAAAKQGNLAAMNNLAFSYLHGLGVAKDSACGFTWAMEAAKRGFAPAQTLVGECYLEGIGVEPDLTRAETWLYRAARLGNKRAMRLLETR